MKSNELILLVNKGGLEFGKSFRGRLDQDSLYFVCHESLEENFSFMKGGVLRFYRKKTAREIIPDNDLKVLRNIDRQIFKEMTDNPGYSDLLKSYLSQKIHFSDMLSSYFRQNYSIPSNIRNKNRLLIIYIIADFNNQFDFFMANGLLYTLQDVIAKFMSADLVRAVLLSPEFDAARADRSGKLQIFCQNMNFLHLLRQYVKYNLEVVMCASIANDISWQSFYHFIRFGIFKKILSENKLLSCIIPFLLPAINPGERKKFLHNIHDSIISKYLLACSTEQPSEINELIPVYNRQVNENISSLFSRNRKHILYRFKHDHVFSDFTGFLKSLVSDYVKTATDFMDVLKFNYINGLLSFEQIQKFIKSTEDGSLKSSGKEIKTGILAIKKQFKFIRQRSRFRIIKDVLTGKDLLPDKEIKALTSFYYKTISVIIHKQELTGLASKILQYLNDSGTHPYCAFCTDSRLNERLAGFVKDRYLDDINPSQLKKDILDAPGKIYFLDENAIKQIYNYFDKQIIEKFLSGLNTGEDFIKIWKKHSFPLSKKIDLKMFAVGQNKHILDHINTELCSGINWTAQFTGAPEKSRLNVISKNVDSEEQSGVIYYIIG